jgi:hypothetical protein
VLGNTGAVASVLAALPEPKQPVAAEATKMADNNSLISRQTVGSGVWFRTSRSTRAGKLHREFESAHTVRRRLGLDRHL